MDPPVEVGSPTAIADVDPPVAMAVVDPPVAIVNVDPLVAVVNMDPPVAVANVDPPVVAVVDALSNKVVRTSMGSCLLLVCFVRIIINVM